MNSQHTLKELQTRKAKLQAELTRLNQEKGDIYKACKDTGKKIFGIVKQINNISANPMVIEHAVLRYLERIDGINIAAVKEKILNPKILKQINTLGSGKYPLIDKHLAIVRNKTIVSVT